MIQFAELEIGNMETDISEGAGRSIVSLVNDLPECYQPIFGHPELSSQVSRASEDRLSSIIETYDRLSNVTETPLKVLDLGCAQGFFSLNLAARGADVTGIDFLDKNVAVCNALALENPDFKATFQHGQVEAIIESLNDGDFDLVLGLSVFHHIIHAHGLDATKSLLRKLAKTIDSGIYEFARHDEPLYWAASQPADTTCLIHDYDFKTILGNHSTHLSTVERPFYFVSNRFWMTDKITGEFSSHLTTPHEYGGLEKQGGPYKGTRTYFIGDKFILKAYDTTHNELGKVNEENLRREAEVLTEASPELDLPKIHEYNEFEGGAYLVRECVKGDLLSQVIESDKEYEPHVIVMKVLDRLVELENQGLYHDDLRTWNVVLCPTGAVRLIDFASIGPNKKDITWPHDLMMVALIFWRQVFDRVVANPVPILTPLLNPGRLPNPHREAFVQLFDLPHKERTFGQLKKLIDKNSDFQRENGQTVGNCELMEKMEQGSMILQRLVS